MAKENPNQMVIGSGREYHTKLESCRSARGKAGSITALQAPQAANGDHGGIDALGKGY